MGEIATEFLYKRVSQIFVDKLQKEGVEEAEKYAREKFPEGEVRIAFRPFVKEELTKRGVDISGLK